MIVNYFKESLFKNERVNMYFFHFIVLWLNSSNNKSKVF